MNINCSPLCQAVINSDFQPIYAFKNNKLADIKGRGSGSVYTTLTTTTTRKATHINKYKEMLDYNLMLKMLM